MYRKIFGISLICLAASVAFGIPAIAKGSSSISWLIILLFVTTITLFFLQRREQRESVAAPSSPAAMRPKPLEPQDQDMNHLLKHGWMYFLGQLERPDPRLWHEIATDFHEIDSPQDRGRPLVPFVGIDPGGRLDVAFWIVEQPDCDRATASDFIRGFVANELYEIAVRDKATALLSAFSAVIKRYNSGFYRWHGIHADELGIEPIAGPSYKTFDETAVADMMAQIERRYGADPIERPVNLLVFEDVPVNPMPGAFDAGLMYSSQDGTGLKKK